MSLRAIKLTVDASWMRQDGSSGWAAVVETDDGIKTLCGPGLKMPNNGVAELYAVVQALKAIHRPSNIQLRVDATEIIYLADNIEAFAAKKFMRTKRCVMKNYELLKSFWTLLRRHNVEIVHVKGHSGDWANTKADKVAALARIKRYRSE